MKNLKKQLRAAIVPSLPLKKEKRVLEAHR